MNTKNNKDCDLCTKRRLSLLLLRPSPIATGAELRPPGAEAVLSDDTLMSGLLPARRPTESRFALRLLREGYVHVYIEKPPAGVKHWLVLRVTEQADLVPDNEAAFNQPGAPFVCSRQGHNPLGMKLLELPQAHLIKEIWLAYSANLWNASLRERNKANPAVMQKISLAGGSPNTFVPSETNLRSKVLECALTVLKTAKATDHDIPFSGVATSTAELAAQLTRAAAGHPRTAGKELAVVLRDPVGIVIELNELRLRRQDLAARFMAQPENLHALNSSATLMGLKKVMMDANAPERYVKVSPLMTRGKFESQSWPPDTGWEPLTEEDRRALIASASSIFAAPYRAMFERPDMGRVIYADHEARAAKWVEEETERNWANIGKMIDDRARLAWLETFEQTMRVLHLDALERFETDWWSARKDVQCNEYFMRHFDENDPNSPLKLHSPGIAFTREVARATTPEPHTQGAIQREYLGELTADVTKPAAIMLRALVANQAEAIAALHQVMSLDLATTPEYLHEKRNDKLYDLGNGLVQGALAKYSWLSTGLGHLLGGYSLAISQSLVAAVTSRLAAPGAALAADAVLVSRAMSVLLVQRTTDLALDAIIEGKGLKTPVLLTRGMPIDEAMEFLRTQGTGDHGMSRSQLKRVRRSGQARVNVSVLTDSHTLAVLGANTDVLFRQGGATVRIGNAAIKSQGQGVPSGTIGINDLDLAERVANGPAALANRAALAASDSLSDARAIVTTLAGRLALGTVLINGMGVLGNLATIRNPKDADELRYAWYGLYDAGSGMLSGVLEVWNVVATAQYARISEEVVAGRSAKLTAIRAAAYSLGAVAGVVNAVANWDKEGKALERGDAEVARLYFLSGLAFSATAVTSSLLAAGILADRLLERGIGGAAVRNVATRFGSRGAASLFGLSASGWGLALLGLGLIFEAGAIALTPTPMQRWAGRSRFGRDSGTRYANWNYEAEDLKRALKKAAGGSVANMRPDTENIATPRQG